MEEVIFSEEETETLKELTSLYRRVKELMIYAEEMDPEKRTFLPPVNELRNAFDHLMRVYAFKFGLISANSEYVSINLQKTFGHVYRAGYDLLDWTSIQLRNKILNGVDEFSSETLATVFPKYYQEIRPDLEIASSEISKIRAEKDIGDPDEDDFIKYIKIIERLKNHLEEIDKIKVSLIEYENEKKKRARNSRLWQVFFIIIGTIIGGAIVAILM